MPASTSEHHAAEVGEDLAQVGVEARRRGAVDHAVVPRQRQRQDQARLRTALPSHTGFGLRSCDTPRIATSGALMIGVK